MKMKERVDKQTKTSTASIGTIRKAPHYILNAGKINTVVIFQHTYLGITSYLGISAVSYTQCISYSAPYLYVSYLSHSSLVLYTSHPPTLDRVTCKLHWHLCKSKNRTLLQLQHPLNSCTNAFNTTEHRKAKSYLEA